MITILILSLVLLDFLTGLYKHTSTIRIEQFKFRMEVSPLETSTNHLIPNLSDSFINEQLSQKENRKVTTDSQGLLIGPIKKEFGIPILFLGGSTTENNEVDEEFRFPYLAPKLLSKDSSIAFFGVNAGVRAHTTQDTINLYINHPSSLITSSSAVLVMHNINDRLRLKIDNNYKAKIDNPNPSSLEGIRQGFLYLVKNLWLWVSSKSNILFLLDHSIDNFFKSYRGIEVNERLLDRLPPPDFDQVKKYKQNLRNLLALIKVNNQKPILITQPLGKNSNAQDVFNNAIRDVAAELKIDLIDLAREMNKEIQPQKLFYDDYIHFNNFGSIWASEIISKRLGQILNIKKSVNSKCIDLKVNGSSIVDADLNKDLLNGRYPSFNSTESKILFQTNNSKKSAISILDVVSGDINSIINMHGEVEVEHPTWMTDDKVLYVRKIGNKRSLYIYDLNKRSNKLLEIEKGISSAIPFVGNGGDIFFSGYKNENEKLTKPSIYVFKQSNNKLIKLTNNNSEDWRPFLDGLNNLYFINNESGYYQIYSKKNDSAKKRLIPSDNPQWDPTISPDSKFIAYAEKNQHDFNLFIKKIIDTKSKPKQLTFSTNDEWDPRFSPKANYLLYSGNSVFGDQIRALCLK
jgi:hypothetical protein